MYIFDRMQTRPGKIIITMFFLVLSVVIIDEGIPLSLTCKFLSADLCSEHHNDTDIPHQQHNILPDDEKLVSDNFIDLSLIEGSRDQIRHNDILKTIDYTVLIWQPPKSI